MIQENICLVLGITLEESSHNFFWFYEDCVVRLSDSISYAWKQFTVYTLNQSAKHTSEWYNYLKEII